jgi:hypothetical protein
MTSGLRRRFGPPLYRDRSMAVWDLDQVRRRTADAVRSSQ